MGPALHNLKIRPEVLLICLKRKSTLDVEGRQTPNKPDGDSTDSSQKMPSTGYFGFLQTIYLISSVTGGMVSDLKVL